MFESSKVSFYEKNVIMYKLKHKINTKKPLNILSNTIGVEFQSAIIFIFLGFCIIE